MLSIGGLILFFSDRWIYHPHSVGGPVNYCSSRNTTAS